MGQGNAVFLEQLAAKAQNGISGTPGNFVFNADMVPGLAANDSQNVESAVTQANQAAVATPSAATGTPAGGSTAVDKISSVIGAITDPTALTDFQDFEAGATAQLNWWGWDLNLNQKSTLAFQNLLTNDLNSLAGAFSALIVSPPFAAALIIIKALTSGLSQLISSENKGNGVNIKGFFWIVVWVEAN
jgi:hypothetical protein